VLRLAVGALLCAPAPAQEGGGRIPVRIVEDRLVVTCDVSSAARRIPVNLFVEIETLCGLQLHNRAAFELRLESAGGQPRPVTLHFPDFAIALPKREHGDEEYLEEFTKYHSKELGENAVVGVIGVEVFRDWFVTLDLAAGFIELRPARSDTDGALEEAEGSTVVPITVHNDMAWLPVRYQDGKPGAMAIGTRRYDTLVDQMVCDELGRPAGDIGRLRVGSIDLSRFVALRPEEVVQVHPDGVCGVTGLNLLQGFRVEIDRINRSARLTQTAPAEFPEADRAFFKAMIWEQADRVESWLEQYGESRLAKEAAELLVDLRLDEGAEDESTRRAIRWINDSMVEDLRATRLMDLMIDLSNAGWPDFVIAAGELGIESGRKDRYPNAVHEIHSKLGDVLLEKGEGRRAWKHLLSAAFGLPEDGMVNLNLGRYYEQEGRYKRAFSRYVQACIRPESGPAAIEALERVQPLLPEEDSFSVDLVERLVGGKVKSFGTASRFKADDLNFRGRVALVEFFTNAGLGDGMAGAIGGALGNQGLIGHFPPENVAFLSYHLPDPAPDPMVNEVAEAAARRLGIDRPVTHVVNGLRRGPGAARWRQGEAVYNDVRKAVLAELDKDTQFELDLEADVDAQRVSGTLVVRGPAGERDLRVWLVLAEKGVLFPGKSEVVIHRMVARAALADSLEGIAFSPVEDEMRLAFTQSLSEVTAANREYLDRLERSGAGGVVRMSLAIDAAQVRIVAFLRDEGTGEVLQAVQVDPEGPEAGQ
jgi:tetratricopeptide (TPR) repeat protein